MKFIDLFSGIGGFRMAMEAAGHECVGFCEIDKYAVQSYRAIYDTEGEFYAEDITRVNPGEFPDFDCLTGGFPCQSFSIAGKRGGFDDTRGTLFFDIARIAEARRPDVLLLENVKGLLSHDGGGTFRTILRTLDELGYDLEWQVLNSKDFGVPQNRERVFIVGHLRGQSRRPVFPLGGTGQTADCQQVSDGTGISHAIDANYHKGLGPSQIGRGKRTQIIQTVKMDSKGTHVTTSHRIRRLTPRECWRLQGFPDWAFDKAKQAGLSDMQLYKQAGNSVTVNVVYEIAKRLT